LKWFPERRGNRKRALAITLALAGVACVAAARDAIPTWLQYAEAGSRIENALFRSVSLPNGAVLARRPPREALPLLDKLVQEQPDSAELYALRALQDEQQLDFVAAERDWKLNAEHAVSRGAAQLALADFYHRRLRPQDEIHALGAVAQAPSSPAERLLPPAQQQSWGAFERIFTVIAANAFPAEVSEAQYHAWIARYPGESQLYVRYFDFLLEKKEFAQALALISESSRAFPGDTVFPVKARALLEYRRGNVEQGLAVYEQSFQPLWPRELVEGFFELLRRTQNLRKFLDQSQAALRANPGDLNAAARLFYYYQQGNKPDAARQVMAEFRRQKEAGHTPWKGEELYTLGRLLEESHAPSEAARYYYALYNSADLPEARERALAGLARILLDAPQEPIRLGAGDLSMYKDIGTLDPGPGFLNGILSLLLNSTDPRQSLAQEEQQAVPYFHRARAAGLLALLDQQSPNSSERAPLHTRLIQVLSDYGESEAVIRQGRQYLDTFPKARERTRVSLLMADAYGRLNRPEDEFAIYDAVLAELAEKTEHVPIGSGRDAAPVSEQEAAPQGETAEAYNPEENEEQPAAPAAKSQAPGQALSIRPRGVPSAFGPRSVQYAQVLDRYLARLVSLKRIPQALEVLRREVDHNPKDPGLYERLVQFLGQNQLDAQIEEVYRRAIQQFPDRSWYHKLARWYLRQRRMGDLEKLTGDVVRIFSGSELDDFFRDSVGATGPQLYLQLNLYANRRFPHDLTFVRNLLRAYQTPQTHDLAAWENLLRQHWFEADDLRAQFFEHLARTRKLEEALAALPASDPAITEGRWEDAARSNPSAVQFYAEAQLWRSHFEAAMPALGAVAGEFPADFDIGRRASTVYRSLAYFEPGNTAAAVRIEQNLLLADPGNRETLARIGDMYADQEQLAEAAPFWARMAEIEPGKADSYVQAATVFWDYYEFDQALRILDEGRRKLGDGNLFGYEEGAIYEGKRDYGRGLEEYVKGALAGGEHSPAEGRLGVLAGRPKLRALADAALRQITEGENPSLAAIRLRVRVLRTQDRKEELRTFLYSLLSHTSSLELAQEIETLGQELSLESVREQAIEREVALTTDPVTRLQLRYRLVQLYEGKKDFSAAQRNVEALYREYPRILGVVRATVDFYWRRKMRQQAVDLLLQAAKDSYPDLRNRFTFEAARKATDADNFVLARQLLDSLLQESPYDAELLAAMAETYARAGDDRGLRDFYLAKMDLFRKSTLPPEQRNESIAALRRGLIPALARLKDFSGAVDQYIELINRYPEDQGLTSEAALFAGQHALGPKLVAFYVKTVADSPRDYRWPMVVARLQTSFENYPAALEYYSKAIGVRPDRADLFIARANLFERLARFDEAAADYEKLYSLSYHDAKWMLKVAEVRARQGKVDETVHALEIALLEGRPASPAGFFAVAQNLESWGMLSQARDFAQKGADTAGDDLLAIPENHAGARVYTRLMTRLRRQDEAFARLRAALHAARESSSSPAAILRGAERQGLAAVTDSEWRARDQKIRAQAAHAGMQAAMKEAGAAVARFFVPEEKVAFQQLLEAQRAGLSASDLEDFLLPAADDAGLADLQARWEFELMMADPPSSPSRMARLIAVQSRRLRFVELGRQLETLSSVVPPNFRTSVLEGAADAYRSEGDAQAELRALSAADRGQLLNGERLQRYFELLLSQQPEKLVAIAAGGQDYRRDAAANFALSNGTPQFAYQVISARSAGRPPVWSKAYAALSGLYFADPGAAVGTAFRDALDDQTIADRLGKTVDRDQRLAGDIWFYYGSRYGEYLGVTHQGQPEDYLPSGLEHSPGNADAYLIAAQSYADAGDLERAILDYRHALELAPNRAAVRDELAQTYWKQGKSQLAIAEWKRALAVLAKEVDRQRVPESFWTEFGSISAHLAERHLALQLKPEMDGVLRPYLRRNGTYRELPLLHSAYLALGNPVAATGWLLDLASAAKDAESVLSDAVNASWIPLPQRQPLYQRILELEQTNVEKSQGDEKEAAAAGLRQWQIRWVGYLIRTKQFQAAKQALDPLKENLAGTLELEIAAGLNTLDATLEGYRTQPDTTPPFDSLRQAARSLARTGQKDASQKILEFVYSRAIESRDLTAANFLGLAEIRLEKGDTAGALDLLRRLTLVVGQPFENLDAAAGLLEKTGHPTEAAEFLQQLVSATPWDPVYRLRWAEARLAAGNDASGARKDMAALAASSAVPYEIRARAAGKLATAGAQSGLGSRELDLLAAAKPISAQDADRPFFLRARLQAAGQPENGKQRINLLRCDLEDDPSFDAPRIPLFFAASEAQQYALALADMEPLLRTGLLGNAAPVVEGSEDETQSDQQGQEPTTGPPRNSQLPSRVPSREQKARLAAALSSVEEHLGRLPQAIQYLQTARTLETTTAGRAAVRRTLMRLQRETNRMAANAARRPVIHNALEQDRVVRPLLAAVAETKGGTPQKEERKQP
jgi:predicted Zn-dependent protease